LSLPSEISDLTQVNFTDLAGIVLQGQTLSVDFVFAKPVTVNGAVWSELFLQTGPLSTDSENGDPPYTQYVVFGGGTRAYLIDEDGDLIEAEMADWQGGRTSSPAPTAGVLETDRGLAGADLLAYTAGDRRVAGIRFDLVLPNTGETLEDGRIGVSIDGIVEDTIPQIELVSVAPTFVPPPTHSHGPAVSDPAFAVSKILWLQTDPDFLQVEFSELKGTVMKGQVLSLDVVFPRILQTQGPVWSELLLQTAPSNTSDSGGDYPYSQYVVFGTGSRAYLIDQNGGLVDAAMTDWEGGSTNSPGPTAAILETDHGWAGANMIARPYSEVLIAGIRFDLVLPDTDQILEIGRVVVNLEGIVVGDNPRGSALIEEPITAPASGNPPSGEESSAGTTSDSSSPTSTNDSGNPPPAEDEATASTGTAPSAFSIPNLGGVSRVISVVGPRVTGYARAQIIDGATPSGLVIFSRRQSGILVNESAAPVTPLLKAGRTHIEVNADGSVNTQVLMANPNPDDANVIYELRDLDGNIYRSGNFVLTGAGVACDPSNICNQVSTFVDESPFSSGRNIEGTLTLTSTMPISVMAFRAFYNERTPSDLLLTNQAVVDLTQSSATGLQVIPYFGVGEGMKSRLVLLNPTGRQLRGRVELRDIFGSAGDGVVSPLEYSLAPNSARTIAFVEELSPVKFGSVFLVPTDGDTAPTATVIFGYKVGDITVSEAGIPVTMGTAFRMYAGVSSLTGMSTAVSVSNATSQAGTVTYSITDFDGNVIDSRSRPIAPFGKLTRTLDSWLLLTESKSVVVRITTDLPMISVVGLRQQFNERQPEPDYLFTSIVPVLENSESSSRELVFPQFVAGEGWTSKIILLSGTSGAAADGILYLMQPDGTPFGPDAQ
jgi:hypothetical protein